MRQAWLAVGIGLALLCSGCDLRGMWRGDAERINDAVPVNAAVAGEKARLDQLLAQDPQARARLQGEYQRRLGPRALQCLRQDLSAWDSKEKIRGKLDAACIDGADQQLREWLLSARLRLLLDMPALGSVPAAPPALIAATDSASIVGVAAAAPVMALASRRRLEVLDAASGETLFLEDGRTSQPGFLAPSPNGRVFAVGETGAVSLRDSRTGEVLARYADQRAWAWLSPTVVLTANQDLSSRSLLDLATGQMSPAKGLAGFWGDVVQIAAQPPTFVSTNLQRMTKFELRLGDSGPQIVVLDQRDVPVAGGSNGSLVATADGAFVARPGGHAFLVSDTAKMNTQVVDGGGFQALAICPLEDPNELLLHGVIDADMTHELDYIYSVDDGGFAPVEDERLVAPGGYSNRCSVRVPVFDAVYVQSAGVFKRFDNVRRGAKYHAGALQAYFGDMREVQRVQAQARDRNAHSASDFLIVSAGGRIVPNDPGKPAPENPGKPVLGELGKDSQILALGVYEPANSSRGAGAGTERWPGPVTVMVRPADQPIVLVLSSYEAVTWHLNVMAGARLKAVLLGGYKESTVVGAGDVRIITIKGYAYDAGSQGYRTLDDEVLRWTGRRIDSLQGRYSGSSFLVGGR